ncbi:hypothetical protein Bsph_1218 [Lysinibacillus sphaericus C3-41]|uniref:Uncharacterized protein n=1 Tax=Lysinibacillus sphaericus (strain C3-41) TaxID=444177 RepID=B1HNX4_LYSSC|nr:hypothetical protein Bsph_1218 [Lysinibacillus sphaericus C3-41]
MSSGAYISAMLLSYIDMGEKAAEDGYRQSTYNQLLLAQL